MLEILHPTLRGRSQLRQEWKTHLKGVITGLLDAAPNMQSLELHLLDADPSFTMSKLRLPRSTENSSGWWLRWTPIVEGMDPANMPTLLLDSNAASPSNQEPAFVAFDRLAHDLIKRRAVRHFPIIRRDVNFMRADIDGFIESLAEVSTHPLVRVNDTHFDVRVVGPKRLLPAEGRMEPWEVRELYEEYVNGSDVKVFEAELDVAKSTAVLRIEATPNETLVEVPVAGKHLVAAFVLLVLNSSDSQEVIFVDKAKPGWTLDVPGGKLATGDVDWSAAIHRELVEELSFHVDSRVAFTPAGWVYDAKSRKEGGPVIAGYAIHNLSREDAHYARSFLVGGSESSGSRIVTIKTGSLLAQKRASQRSGRVEEAVCHAPLRVVEKI